MLLSLGDGRRWWPHGARGHQRVPVGQLQRVALTLKLVGELSLEPGGDAVWPHS